MPPAQDSVTWRIITSTGTNIAIKYVRDGKEDTAFAEVYHPPTHWYERKSLRKLVILPEMKAVVYSTVSNSPAARAGLTNGDEIIALNGQKIFNPQTLASLEDSWSNTAPQPITLTVKRGTSEFECPLLAVKPLQPTNSTPLLGFNGWQADTNASLVHPNPMDQISDSVSQITGTIGALFASKSDIGVQQLGGAVMIIRVYSNLFQDEDGWRRVLWFSVILNVNLALLNLLPLPVLDGGHITLSLIEAVRRRPVSASVLNFIQSGFAALLISFMVYIAFFDTGDWLRSAHADREVPVIFAPQK
jgi:regulator of sigma E protease